MCRHAFSKKWSLLLLASLAPSAHAQTRDAVFSVLPTSENRVGIIGGAIGGVPLEEQAPGSLSTIVSGQVVARLGFLGGPSVAFLPGTLADAAPNGVWAPGPGGTAGSASADLAGQAVLGPGNVLQFAIRDATATLDSSFSYAGAGEGGSFVASTIMRTTLTGGHLDLAAGGTGASFGLSGFTHQVAIGIGVYAADDGWRLQIPILARLGTIFDRSTLLSGQVTTQAVDLNVSSWRGSEGGDFAADANWIGDPAPTSDSIAVLYQDQAAPITFAQDHTTQHLGVRGTMTFDLGGHRLDVAGTSTVGDGQRSDLSFSTGSLTVANGVLATEFLYVGGTQSPVVDSLLVRSGAGVEVRNYMRIDNLPTKVVVEGELSARNLDNWHDLVVAAGGTVRVTERLLNRARLAVNGQIDGDVQIWEGFDAASLTGEFLITGDVVLRERAVLAPGDGVGAATIGGDLLLGEENVLELDIDDARHHWDSLTVGGTLVLGAVDPSRPIVVQLVSRDATGLPGMAANFDPDQDHAWTFLTASAIDGFDRGKFLLDTSRFGNPILGAFDLVAATDRLIVTYSAAVPEAGTPVLVAAALLAFALVPRKRRPQP